MAGDGGVVRGGGVGKLEMDCRWDCGNATVVDAVKTVETDGTEATGSVIVARVEVGLGCVV